MTLASFQSLCLDAHDAPALAGFWGAALGLKVVDTDDGGRRVVAREEFPGEAIWVDPVPEDRTVKTRVHLDLRLPAADPAPLLEVGAALVREPGDGVHWWVLADPDGNQFCAMPPAPAEWGIPPVEHPTAFELVVDSVDPEAQARWWAGVLGGTAATREGTANWWIQGAAGFPWYFWVFAAVPEPKTVKNRMHWDVRLTGSDPSPLLAAGATMLRERDDEIDWWVLADPEGNEFCAFEPAG